MMSFNIENYTSSYGIFEIQKYTFKYIHILHCTSVDGANEKREKYPFDYPQVFETIYLKSADVVFSRGWVREYQWANIEISM